MWNYGSHFFSQRIIFSQQSAVLFRQSSFPSAELGCLIMELDSGSPEFMISKRLDFKKMLMQIFDYVLVRHGVRRLIKGHGNWTAFSTDITNALNINPIITSSLYS